MFHLRVLIKFFHSLGAHNDFLLQVPVRVSKLEPNFVTYTQLNMEFLTTECK